ncbi:MAG: indolepyruvate ferredoxin oxidoreductase subunit alpha [Clostridia bacterium]|nr:indolepyruvate ferredoxin oxidoreductase subunit alpha [Clostridia bacterium]
MRALLTGNEAVARGAYEAGVKLASGYPGAPSTEVMESISSYKEVYSEWSTNEKVALEVAIGASFAGYRSFAVMKTVGLNVASDALMFAAGSQINGGLVIVVSDDVGRSSGDDYNDCRFYGQNAAVPILEPSDSQEAKDFMKLAFEISEEFSTPVILRLTSVTCKTKSLVEVDESYVYQQVENHKYDFSFQRTMITTMMTGIKNPTSPKLAKYYNNFTGTMRKLEDESNQLDINKLELDSKEIGVITAGVAYSYVKEALPEASVLKLGMINPLPRKLIKEIASYVKTLYVIEEGQNVLERNIKNIGVNVIGEELFPRFPEMIRLTPDIIEEKIIPGITKNKPREDVPFRLPMNCAGCSHLFVYHVLKKHKIKASIDITCGIIGAFPHVDAFRNAKCMGSAIGVAHGYNVLTKNPEQYVAVIGDGGFWNTGISGLINLVYNSGNSTVIIMDNSCVAMTGGQCCPSSGFGINYKPENNIEISDICKAVGIKDVAVIDPYNVDELEDVILKAVKSEGNSVVVVKKECITAFKPKRTGKCQVKQDSCSKCKLCLKIGCLAIERKVNAEGDEVKINGDICMGCKLCTNVCKRGAIEYVQE